MLLFKLLQKVISQYILSCQYYLLNKIIAMQRVVPELSPASQKYKMLPRDIYPVLEPLELHQLSMENV
jgi:hypothetical protein